MLQLAQAHALNFRPDLVLTVWNSAYLLAASDLAEKLAIPLALVCHDDYEKMLPAHPRKRAWADQRLRFIYQRAKARICVSHGMVEHMAAIFGSSPTDILFPIPAEAPFPGLPARVRRSGEPLRIGFFGEMSGNFDVFNAVADALPKVDAEFHFFSHGVVGSDRRELTRRLRVFDHGVTDPRGLHVFFRDNIDVILIPQGFESADLQLRRTCFPSKLPEACQIGLPLLIVAPPEASAARWGITNLDTAVVLQSLKEADLTSALTRFRDNAFWKRQQDLVASVAQGAFHPEKLQRQFENILARVLTQPPE